MNLNDKAQLMVAVVILLGALGGYVKWLRPKALQVSRDVRASRDALLGREAIYDSITGEPISPALPGIGHRVATLELAVVQLADMKAEHRSLDQRVSRLEKAEGDRAHARTESIELLRTIEAAIQADPNTIIKD